LSGWSEIQEAEEMNVGRFMEYDSDAIDCLRKWLPFIQGNNVKALEIGAGSGYFTGKMLELNPQVKLTCVEPDPQLAASLRKRLGRRIEVLEMAVEDMRLSGEFDVAVCHIVLHNIYKPVASLIGMKEAVKPRGWVAAIEPARGGFTRYPSADVQAAFALLDQAGEFGWRKRRELYGFPEDYNSWTNCYAQLFDEAGLRSIRCHGIASVVTLSDTGIRFAKRRKWIQMRLQLLESQRPKKTSHLVAIGKPKQDVVKAYDVAIQYLRRLADATEEGLSHVHEQEIYYRTLTVGRRE